MSDYSPRACIPTAPILERIEEWIERHNYVCHSNTGELSGGAQTFELMCGLNHRVLRRQKMMTFDLADRILCKIGRSMDWYFHPVLAPVYAELRLRPNEQDMRISGDEEALKELLRCRAYTAKHNQKRSAVRAEARVAKTRDPHYAAAMKQRSEPYDVLESEQVAA